MICPQCSTKIRNRVAKSTCEKCRYEFALLPNNYYGLSDNYFIKKLKALSGDNWYYFTYKQLYFYILRSKAILNFGSMGGIGLVIFLVSVFLAIFKSPAFLLLIILGFVLMIVSAVLFNDYKLRYTPEDFESIVLKRWESKKGKVEKLINSKELDFKTPEHTDLFDYSFDALIITGDIEIANFLIKNDFHFKNKTAIVTYKKYPNHLFPYVIEQIEKNPSIPIILIHNADIMYADLKKVIQKNWFTGLKVNIIDLGITPHQVRKSKMVIKYKRKNFDASHLNYDLSEYSDKDKYWFKNGYYVDMNIIPPVKLLNMLEKAISIYKTNGIEELNKVSSALLISALSFKLKKGTVESSDDLDFG